jgi:hypothetical protein
VPKRSPGPDTTMSTNSSPSGPKREPRIAPNARMKIAFAGSATRQMYVPRGMRCQRMRAAQSDSRSRGRLRKRYDAASTASWAIGVSGAARFTAAQYARPLGRCSMSGNPPRCRYISEAVQPMRAPSAGTHNSTSTMSRFARRVTLVVEDGASLLQGSPDRATTRYRPARRR